MAGKWQKQDRQPALSACRDGGWTTSRFPAAQNSAPQCSQAHPALLTRLPPCPAGSDQWKMAERKLFNKGIAIYKKDFFLVQKLVSWGSVSGAREGQEPLQDLGAPSAKESACSAGGQGLIPGWEDPLEKEMATHFSILAWRIPMDRGAWRARVHGVTESDTI